MENLSQLGEIEQQYDNLADTGQYAETLDLVTRNAHLFPEDTQAELHPRYGVECSLDIYADLEHAFPLDFEHMLPEGLDFVMREGRFARET